MPQHCVAHMWVIRRVMQLALSHQSLFIYHWYSFLTTLKICKWSLWLQIMQFWRVLKGHLDHTSTRVQMKVNVHRPNIINQFLKAFIEKPSAFLGILSVTINCSIFQKVLSNKTKVLSFFSILSLLLWTNTNISQHDNKNRSLRTWLWKRNFCENSLFAISRKPHTFKPIQDTPCWVYCCFTFLNQNFMRYQVLQYLCEHYYLYQQNTFNIWKLMSYLRQFLNHAYSFPAEKLNPSPAKPFLWLIWNTSFLENWERMDLVLWKGEKQSCCFLLSPYLFHCLQENKLAKWYTYI